MVVHVTATNTAATTAGKKTANRRGTSRKSSAATIETTTAHIATRESPIVLSWSRHQIDSASSSDVAGTPISVEYGSTPGSAAARTAATPAATWRSEERRVGKECRAWRQRCQ